MSAGPTADAAQHMDGIYRYQRYIYDATRKYYLLGRDRMIAGLLPPPGGTVLEIGCGTGRNLILAAKRYPDARFYGFDISNEMLTTARAAVARAGLSDRVQLAQGDATDFDTNALFGVPSMDRAFCSYTLSMIPPWEAVLPQAVASVGPTGSVHVVDFGDMGGWPGWFGSAMYAWLAKFTVTPRETLEPVLQSAADDAGASLAFEMLYRRYAQLGVITKTS
ncbi:MAG: methyltransferase domain-containing protein [Pseudomonadota bacterium]